MKLCTRCEQSKSLSDFNKDRSRPDGLYIHCRSCYRIKKKRWYSVNREGHARWLRKSNLKRKFGLTIEQYEDLLRQQRGVCALCVKKCRTGNRLAVDHCHLTGRIRGLLCYRCNTHLGWFELYQTAVMGYLYEDLDPHAHRRNQVPIA